MKMELSALSYNESFARSTVAAFCLGLNPSLSELSDIKTAVSEAVTNCVVHGYKEKSGTIRIECDLDGDENGGVLHIKISDAGCGITDVDKAVQPFFTSNAEGERSGMGFTIMQTFMDGFHVESEVGKGTTVSMEKRIGERVEVNAQ